MKGGDFAGVDGFNNQQNLFSRTFAHTGERGPPQKARRYQ